MSDTIKINTQEVGRYTIDLLQETRTNGEPYYMVSVNSPRMKWPKQTLIGKNAAYAITYWQQTVNNYKGSAQIREEWKEKNKDAKRTFKEQLKVGSILNTSWGYDQTNVEYYQVLSIKGDTVQIREISAELKETGFMCGQSVPIPGAFVRGRIYRGEESTPELQAARDQEMILTRKIGAGRIKINESASAHLWSGTAQYVSWYA